MPAVSQLGNTPLPPAIIFHGSDNAISIVRALGKRGIKVFVLNEAKSEVHRSRYAQSIPISSTLPFKEAAANFLLGSASDTYAGAIVLAASDEALETIAEHRDVLAAKFRLDLSNPVAQQQILDKLATYQIADLAGVPTPRYWNMDATQDLEMIRHELVYPLLVKPVLSHLFQRKFNTKFIVAHDFASLKAGVRVAQEAEIEVLLLEMIPGADSMLCSYYTYLDETGQPLFDFTKRIVRRFPTNMGLATYHVTDHVEHVKELALRLFQQAGLRGLANAEFKLDARDNTLKLIECNARFTAANGLLARAGFDLASLVYNRLAGLPLPKLIEYRDNVTLWDPMRDYNAYRELRDRGQLSLGKWLASIARPHTFPCFSWSDPIPSIVRSWRRFQKR